MLDTVSFDFHRDLFSQGGLLRREPALRRAARLILPLAAAALCPWLAGCTAGSTAASATAGSSTAGPIQTSSSTTPQPRIAEVTNFGASITCGFYATQEAGPGYVYSKRGYAGRFDSALGVPAQNLCRPGDQAADTVRTWVTPHATPTLGASQLYTVMVGTNDLIGCDPLAPCVANWREAMTAALTWLALPSSDKVLGSSIPKLSSSWTPDLDFGVATSDAGASLSFPVTQTVDGRTLYIGYRVFDSGAINGGTATVKLDGVAVKVLHTVPANSHAIATKNGLTDTIFVAAIPLGAAGSHTVTITTGSSGGFFSFQWAGVSSGSYATLAGAPRVMVATLPQTTSAWYNGLLGTYNNALQDMVASLTADGMYITLVPCDSQLDTTSDYSDSIHPNDTGHGKLAAAFKNAL